MIFCKKLPVSIKLQFLAKKDINSRIHFRECNFNLNEYIKYMQIKVMCKISANWILDDANDYTVINDVNIKNRVVPDQNNVR